MEVKTKDEGSIMAELDPEDARAGRMQKDKPVRKILWISLLLAAIAFFLIWYL